VDIRYLDPNFQEANGHTWTKTPLRYAAFYKRRHFFAVAYAVLDHLVLPMDRTYSARDLDVVCTLRDGVGSGVGKPYLPGYQDPKCANCAAAIESYSLAISYKRWLLLNRKLYLSC
jgi:hypothetical protein